MLESNAAESSGAEVRARATDMAGEATASTMGGTMTQTTSRRNALPPIDLNEWMGSSSHRYDTKAGTNDTSAAVTLTHGFTGHIQAAKTMTGQCHR